jgi:hypothetical protein
LLLHLERQGFAGAARYLDLDEPRPGTRVANLGEFLWAFVHPAVHGDGAPAARMLRVAVDAYGYEGPGLVAAMLASVRKFVEDNPEAGEWGLRELSYMERNADLFEALLGGAARGASGRVVVQVARGGGATR